DLHGDLRYALRSLRKDPLLSATIIITLALGIGATTAIFSVSNAVLLRPLPFPEPDRLMMLFSFTPDGRSGGPNGRVFGPDFVEWRAQCRVCAEMAAFTGTFPGNVAGGPEPDRVRIAHVSDRMFATMGVQPLLGRGFLPDDRGRAPFGEAASDVPRAVVIGYSF